MKLDKHRDLDLSKRKSNTRDKVQPEVIKFDLAEIKKSFMYDYILVKIHTESSLIDDS